MNREAQTKAWHHSTKLSVEELVQRIEQERAAEADRTGKFSVRPSPRSGLPPGWVWPDRDWDAGKVVRVVRPRPYAKADRRCRAEGSTETFPKKG